MIFEFISCTFREVFNTCIFIYNREKLNQQPWVTKGLLVSMKKRDILLKQTANEKKFAL